MIMKIQDLREKVETKHNSKLTRLDIIVTIIHKIEHDYTVELGREINLQLNPDQTSSRRNPEALNMLYTATVSAVGNNYAVNNAHAIRLYIKGLMKSLPPEKNIPKSIPLS